MFEKVKRDMESDETMKKLLDHNTIIPSEVTQENHTIITRMGKTKPHKSKRNCKPSRARPILDYHNYNPAKPDSYRKFPAPEPILSNGVIP